MTFSILNPFLIHVDTGRLDISPNNHMSYLHYVGCCTKRSWDICVSFRCAFAFCYEPQFFPMNRRFCLRRLNPSSCIKPHGNRWKTSGSGLLSLQHKSVFVQTMNCQPFPQTYASTNNFRATFQEMYNKKIQRFIKFTCLGLPFCHNNDGCIWSWHSSTFDSTIWRVWNRKQI